MGAEGGVRGAGIATGDAAGRTADSGRGGVPGWGTTTGADAGSSTGTGAANGTGTAAGTKGGPPFKDRVMSSTLAATGGVWAGGVWAGDVWAGDVWAIADIATSIEAGRVIIADMDMPRPSLRCVQAASVAS